MKGRGSRRGLIVGALVAAVLVVGWLSLRGPLGRRLVRSSVEQRAPVTMDIGRSSGSLLSGMRLDSVTVRTASGAVLARVSVIQVHYSPRILFSRHRHVSVEVLQPE